MLFNFQEEEEEEKEEEKVEEEEKEEEEEEFYIMKIIFAYWSIYTYAFTWVYVHIDIYSH